MKSSPLKPLLFAVVVAGCQDAGSPSADIDQLTDAYLGNRTEITTITRSELQERLKRDQATLIDVRPRAEYDAGHIPGAIPIPPDHLDELLPSLPADREIVAYCRGPY